ncbi:MAG TPA: single-stranded-DNA-specific exonuclease RecJ [Candidatus Sulfotelmatobacter sp.]|nr:single-stranded-DNA-specific exonuclease RecJ [Candidatus Sulfotelmatobacter sp.]
MHGTRPAYDWIVRPASPVSAALAEAAHVAGISERAARLLAGRGVARPADLLAHLGDPRAALHDPRLLPDAAALTARVARARATGERVLVLGDFDADGLTGLAILVTTLRRLGLDTGWHVPARVAEGHGLSVVAIERAAAEGRSLIITVDTGSSSIAEVELASSRGIDVIVTDHHHVPAVPPAAAALVNPHRHDSAYPDPRLAGSGVAFKVAQLLLAREPGGPAAALDLADLAIIGTIADVAPIAGENRAIARLGLARLRQAPRPGIAALLDAAGIAPERVDLERIAFSVAPRLNAAGRLGDVATAASLLLATDIASAQDLAARLEVSNRERRDLTASVLDEVLAAAADLPPGPVIVAGAWPVGLIGLVAGRLAEDRHAPAIVVATGAEPWRASGRGPSGSQLAAAFEACADLLERHGGHPQAAGCQFAAAVFPALRERLLPLLAVPAEHGEPAATDRRTLLLDLAVDAAEVDYRLLRDIDTLGPIAPGEADALVGIRGLAVSRVRAAAGGHTSLVLRRGREVLDAIAFGQDDLASSLAEGDVIDVAARLDSRHFGGFETLQLEVRDVAPGGHLARLAGEAEPAPIIAAGTAGRAGG